MNLFSIRNPHARRRWKRLGGIVTVALLLGGLTACRTPEQVDVSEQEFSGFLGDYSALQPGGKGEANYLYINRAVNFGRFTKVYVEPVQLWKADDADSALGRLSRIINSS